MLFFSAETGDSLMSLKNILEGPLDFLERCRKERKKSTFYEAVKLYFDDCLHILLNLGVWCAHQFAVKGLEDIADKISECRGYFANDWEEKLLHLGRTHFQMFINDSKQVLKAHRGEFHMGIQQCAVGRLAA